MTQLRKSKKSIPSSLPLRSPEHIMEDESKTVLQACLRPWMVAAWQLKDYGIDGMVELTRFDNLTGGYHVVGKRFAVQIKSKDSLQFTGEQYPLSGVPVNKLNYWFNSLEPVLFVLVDLSSNTCYYRWVDDELRGELGQNGFRWLSQKTTTVYFKRGLTIDPRNLDILERYILNYKRPLRTVLAPGNYFRYSQSVVSVIQSIAQLSESYQIDALTSEMHSLKTACRTPVYTVAIVGPSRAGKSTLINALLRRALSPVGVLPTTGIPITFYPKQREKCDVYFKDGRVISDKPSGSFLETYTSQKNNPDNEKQVKLVSVDIVNEELEKGLALCDVPGLDDPDAEIRNITQTALLTVNAVIYVFNAASYADGGFSINQLLISDINRMVGSMDRIFLVFNKVDVLSSDQLQELKTYVLKQLDKYKITPYLSGPPLFLSAQNSFNLRNEHGAEADGVTQLESALWDYLLRENRTGLAKLSSTYSAAIQLIGRYQHITQARFVGSDKRITLEKDFNRVSTDLNAIKESLPKHRAQIYAYVDKTIGNYFDQILAYLQADLLGRPLQSELPSPAALAEWLRDNARRQCAAAHTYLETLVNQLSTNLNSWVLISLKQVEIKLEQASGNSKSISAAAFGYTSRVTEIFKEEQTGPSGFMESIIYHAFNFIGNIVAFIQELLYTEDTRRQIRINELMKKSTKWYQQIRAQFMADVGHYLDEVCRYMVETTTTQTNVYLGQLRQQLSGLTQVMTPEEKENCAKFIQALQALEEPLKSSFKELKAYCADLAE